MPGAAAAAASPRSHLVALAASGSLAEDRATASGARYKYVPTLDQAIGLAAGALSDIADGDDYSSGGLVHAYLNGNVSLAAAQRLGQDSAA